MPRGARGTTTTAAAPVVDASVLEPIARAALEEITPATTIGALRDVTVADDVATVRFATRQGGYLGWFWTVSLAVNPGLEPSVLETLKLFPAVFWLENLVVLFVVTILYTSANFLCAPACHPVTMPASRPAHAHAARARAAPSSWRRPPA